MKRLNVYIIFILLLLCPGIYAQQQANDSVFNADAVRAVTLFDVGNNRPYTVSNPSGLMLLFIFLSPECPLCKNYSPLINNLRQKYAGYVQVIGIMPGKAYPGQVIKEYAEQYNIQYPVCIDADKKLTQYLQASVTPQAILLTDNYELVYKGAIDNKVQALGKMRVAASADYLRTAIEQYIGKQPVVVKRTKAVGCTLNDY